MIVIKRRGYENEISAAKNWLNRLKMKMGGLLMAAMCPVPP
jgi:hypothetical protein